MPMAGRPGPCVWKEKLTRKSLKSSIPAKHGEADAKEPNPGSRSTLTVDRNKKVRKRGMLTEKIQTKSLERPFILIGISC
jgi:hypothetical protein